MIAGLAVITRLKEFSLDHGNLLRLETPPTRAVFPALSRLLFRGCYECFETLISSRLPLAPFHRH